jgi:hypothetical protein
VRKEGKRDERQAPKRHEKGSVKVHIGDYELFAETAVYMSGVSGEQIKAMVVDIRHRPGDAVPSVPGIRVREEQILAPGRARKLLHGKWFAVPVPGKGCSPYQSYLRILFHIGPGYLRCAILRVIIKNNNLIILITLVKKGVKAFPQITLFISYRDQD